MTNSDGVFLVGDPTQQKILNRFLPDISRGISVQWLSGYSDPPKLILDPFGHSYELILDIARGGISVITSANNPLMRHLIRYWSLNHSEHSLNAALAKLSSSKKGNTRLEPYILDLYKTVCRSCNLTVSADEFIWDEDLRAPISVRYHCNECHDEGDYPVTSLDTTLALSFNQNPMNKAWAIEQVASRHDEFRSHVESALSYFTDRTLFTVFAIINAIRGLSLSDQEKLALDQLVLSMLDKSDVMWGHPSSGRRPRVLHTPSQFREFNLWKVIEKSILNSVNHSDEVNLYEIDDYEKGKPGVYIYKGRFRDLYSQPLIKEVDAVISSIPRQNPAFWTLSTIWSCWLWGKENVGDYRSIVRRKRFDWMWQGRALQSVFDLLNEHLTFGTKYFAILGESEPGFVNATLIAGLKSGFILDNIAHRNDTNMTQWSWTLGYKKKIKEISYQSLRNVILSSITKYLQDRGEPCPYTVLYLSGLIDLVGKLAIPELRDENSNAFSEVDSAIEEAVSNSGLFQHLSGGTKGIDTGYWWLINEPYPYYPDIKSKSGREETIIHNLPLMDNVELLVRDQILMVRDSMFGISFLDLDRLVCNQQRGVFTPDIQFIKACTNSYGVLDKFGNVHIKPGESELERTSDVDEIQNIIWELGIRLGFSVEGNDGRILWLNDDGNIMDNFYVSTTAVTSVYLSDKENDAHNHWIVIPGSRADLVLYKREKNPLIELSMGEKWEYIKFRHLRSLAENQTINLINYSEQMKLDPIAYQDAQLRLL